MGGTNGYLGSNSAPATPDATANGALRFTNGKPGGYHQNGAIVSATPFSTGQGLQVTFKTVTYGGDSGGYAGDGADGLSFYLLDGCMPITGGTPPGGCPANRIYGNSTYPGIGAWGGSLAYTCSNTNTPYDGLVGAYLGLGIDEYGNFLNGTARTNGETDYIKNSDGTPYNVGDNTASGGYYRPGRIGLRGAGSVAWQALTTAYGTNPADGGTPYYPASLSSTCSNGGIYSSSTNSCGTVCQAGYSYNPGKNNCVQCAAGTTFYPAGGSGGSGSCNSCPSGGTYNVTSNTCDGIGTCATGTYVPGTPGTCSPLGTCAAGSSHYISSTNMCGTCAAGVYLSGSVQCGICTPAGTYSGGSCTPANSCASGTTFYSGQCYSCPSGSTVDVTSGTAYCDFKCNTGFTYKSGTTNAYPNFCFKCSNGSSHLTQSGGIESCTSGGTLTTDALLSASGTGGTANTASTVAASQIASTPNNPQPITPAHVAPTSIAVTTGVPMSLVATQHTCSTGRLWNYDDIKGVSDSEYYLRIEPIPVFEKPGFLLRTTKAHPDDIRAALIDLSAHIFIFLPGKLSKRRSILPRHLNSGVTI